MLKEIKQLTRCGTVALVTAGLNMALSACDPAPPPLSCDAPSNDPGSPSSMIPATGTLDGTTMTITFDICGGNTSCCLPIAATVAAVTGAELVNVNLAGLADATIVATFTVAPVADGGTSIEGASGTFLLVVPVGDDIDTVAFPVSRTFTFHIVNGKVVLGQKIAALPLQRRDGAAIVVVQRDDGEVLLEPRSSFPGEVEWSVSGGHAVSRADGRVAWRLPEEPGWYQAELVVDDGERGFARDVVTVEVT